MSANSASPHFLDQPKAVWATAFACVVGFMSIGLVDPILTSIAAGLNASPSQVSLLFTSYFFVTSVMMLVTGFVSSRLGGRKTLMVGALLIVTFSALAGTSQSVGELVAFRAGWGLGNAFFVVTALSVIVASSRGGTAAAILMYEAALGLGISAGPLLGAALGGMSWRYPFFGTATLMAIGFVAVAVLLPELPKPKEKIAITAPLKALRQPGLLTTAVAAAFYNYAFFTVLAFVPFVLQMSAHAVGLIFFGWGLLLAVFSVLVAPRLQARLSAPLLLAACLVLFAVLLMVMAFSSVEIVAACVVLSGALMGVCNTVFTEMALEVSTVPRPVASAAYNFVRWFAGVVAPYAAPLLAESFGAHMAFYVACVAALISPIVLFARRSSLGRYSGLREGAGEALGAVPPIAALAAVDGTDQDWGVLKRAAEIAPKDETVFVLHVRPFEVVDEDAVDAESEAEAAAVLDRALVFLQKQGVSAEGEVVEAGAVHVAQTILGRAEAVDAPILVIGERHRDDIGNLVHGSVADAMERQVEQGLRLLTVAAPELLRDGATAR